MKQTKATSPRVRLNNTTREETIKNLQTLRLPGMLAAYSRQYGDPEAESLEFDTRFSMLVNEEIEQRTIRRRQRLLKASRVREGDPSSIENIIYSEERGLKKEQVQLLASCNWITCDTPKTVLICGAAGTGKTWLVKALAKCACQNDINVLYFRYVDLAEKLKEQEEKHNVATYVDRVLLKKKLLIIDDFAMGESPTKALSSALLSLFESRYGQAATIVASQRPWSYWHEWIDDAPTADAIMDRLTTFCYKIELKGRSLRELNKV